MMSLTSTNCMAAFAPLLANVVCCPQVEATLVILMGQSSKHTNTLALNSTVATHCLSDFEQILVGQGANGNLSKICSVRSSNLTEGSCSVSDVAEFESTVDTSSLLAACGKIDSVNECCEQVCQNAILDASRKLAQKAYNLMSVDSGSHALSDHSNRVNDCKSIVLRWLGSKLELSNAKESFVTNLQALNCAASLGVKLRKANITENVYSQCHISLKDFSLQESGCLLPSLPSDVVFDKSAGVSFLCDLNDNIPAPWPATSQLPASSCNKTVKIPALPAAASGQSSYDITDVRYLLCVMVSAALLIIM
ncbi:uncharacterized GPI-anchored protein at1g61900 [Phtheirospermum japonicum]|uniref:Uncharacterized GPI-anchored protein at1g61900 n=1 Tax=Phtheirospermum japonicum TaxID=374723 RepID=A0A830CCR2_9LAMI|nr:uncharacterized GPI-anchored protein at1g61900 [Phtheirospermum japonicum]